MSRGNPNFNLLQSFRSAESHIIFYAFDVLVYRGEDLMKQSLSKRRDILAGTLESHDHAGISEVSPADRQRDGRFREDARARRHCRETCGQYLRSRAAKRTLGKAPPESQSGIRDRRLGAQPSRHRFNCHRGLS
jgi:hypothetical protein